MQTVAQARLAAGRLTRPYRGVFHCGTREWTSSRLDPAIKARLRIRAAEHGRSMEAEARRILQMALGESGRPPVRNLYERIQARFAPLGGVDLELPPREPAREPPR
jgi:antitoxin FitA